MASEEEEEEEEQTVVKKKAPRGESHSRLFIKGPISIIKQTFKGVFQQSIYHLSIGYVINLIVGGATLSDGGEEPAHHLAVFISSVVKSDGNGCR